MLKIATGNKFPLQLGFDYSGIIVEKGSQVEIQYWFPNNGNPTGPNSVFYSQTALIDALINIRSTHY